MATVLQMKICATSRGSASGSGGRVSSFGACVVLACFADILDVWMKALWLGGVGVCSALYCREEAGRAASRTARTTHDIDALRLPLRCLDHSTVDLTTMVQKNRCLQERLLAALLCMLSVNDGDLKMSIAAPL